MNSLLLEFSGKITEKDIYRSSNLDISEEHILKILKENSKNTAYNIRKNIIKETGLNCDATVTFKRGCIEWFGYVEIFYKSLEVLAVISGASTAAGGVLKLAKIAKKSINLSVEGSFLNIFPRKKRKRNISMPKHQANEYTIEGFDEDEDPVYSDRVEPTFEVETNVTSITEVKEHTIDPEKNIERIVINKEQNISPIIYIVLVLAIVANITAFVALALSII